MTNIADEIIKTIKYAIDRKAINCDRTYKTVIKRVTRKGYVIQDEAGQERTVPCGIPNVELRAGQYVYVTLAQGELNEMYISGVIGK